MSELRTIYNYPNRTSLPLKLNENVILMNIGQINMALLYFQIYRELEDTSKHRVVYHSLSVRGPLHGVPVNAHYQTLGVLDRKRLLARKNNTTYCYDFPLVSTVLGAYNHVAICLFFCFSVLNNILQIKLYYSE